MSHRIQEEYESHLSHIDLVVVLQVVFDDLFHGCKIVDLNIQAWLCIRDHEIAVNNGLDLNDLVILQVVIVLDPVLHEILEPVTIFVVDETVLEDAAVFVEPEFGQLWYRLVIVIRAKEETD